MGKKLGISILFGLTTILLLMIIGSTVFSFILKFTSATEDSIRMILASIGGLSIFVGALIAGVKNKVKGWVVGALTSGLFTLIVYLVQFLGYDSSFDFSQTIQHTVYLIVSVLGGILGVNLSGGEQKE